MKEILIIGSEGQLGLEIKKQCKVLNKVNFTFTSLQSLDVTNTQQLVDTIKSKNFDYIVNCTAYTAVDKAEEEVELATKINTSALATIGQSANEIGAKVIHVSTDYVFDGSNHRPYVETDTTNPNSVYGSTKLNGERALLSHNKESMVIRTSWLYSIHGNNFVKTMIRLGNERDELGVIFDQVGTPTYAGDLADIILHIVDADISKVTTFEPGIYHYSNEGVASWYDFTLAIHQKMNISCRVNPIETKDYPTPAPRPHYSVLNKAKIKQVYNVSIPYWKDSLDKCLLLLK
ncbi:dTDP-4-dehydrorhamnose reductase [Carboxylicivirga marina]|uniref:dTDP-4-dehydrorhamnose reductase n=1 Tax=Carboxylicivirga marina TaxID=2800988 RepID=A0ABS1HLA3_9BACT|nr:dTDP-4-dehydrorhamnose reductase [Carboxylicivirga marina]MBK3518455.1 dTDP-4-dehydrorhamnose reductase [Carboxylicivirga marina]